MGCTLARGPAKGARDGQRAAKLGRRCARLLRASPDGAAALRSCVARAADRSSADTGEPRRREGAADGASTICLAKDHAQRFLVGTNDVVDEPLARGRMDH
jgi:hypothetical protein